jgi:predicted amidohydrolase
MEEPMKYDLLLTSGDVLDPSAGLRGVMDIGITGGKIIAVAASLPANEARRTISAKSHDAVPELSESIIIFDQGAELGRATPP